MAKSTLFPALLAAACVVAGVYGALHDQISYTVSPIISSRSSFISLQSPTTCAVASVQLSWAGMHRGGWG